MENRPIIIRKEQLAAFARESTRTLHESIVDDLYENCGIADGFSRGELTSFVSRSMIIGSRLRMDSDGAMFEFVCICLIVGVGFESEPSLSWIQAALEDRSRTAQDRLLEVRFRLRRQVEASHHE